LPALITTLKATRQQRQVRLEHISPPFVVTAYKFLEKYFMDLCEFKEIKPIVKTTTDPTNVDPNSPPMPTCVGNPSEGPAVAFNWGDAEAAIHTFCGNKGYWGTVIAPAISTGTGVTSDGRGKALGASDSFDVNNGADKLWVSLAFSEGECQGFFQFDQGANDDEKLGNCVNNFRTVLNGCNTEGLDNKYGGKLNKVCAVYSMEARKADDTKNPFTLKSEGDLGQFMCKEL
jgi:hypothetical protein